jgi:hypothetical protein
MERRLANPHLKTLNRVVRTVVAPRLANAGFTHESPRLFRRIDAVIGSHHLINFQVGIKARWIRKFTIELGIFNTKYMAPTWPCDESKPGIAECDPALRVRLGFLTASSRDKWWRQSEAPILAPDLIDAILGPGTCWLSTMEGRLPTNDLWRANDQAVKACQAR